MPYVVHAAVCGVPYGYTHAPAASGQRPIPLETNPSERTLEFHVSLSSVPRPRRSWSRAGGARRVCPCREVSTPSRATMHIYCVITSHLLLVPVLFTQPAQALLVAVAAQPAQRLASGGEACPRRHPIAAHIKPSSTERAAPKRAAAPPRRAAADARCRRAAVGAARLAAGPLGARSCKLLRQGGLGGARREEGCGLQVLDRCGKLGEPLRRAHTDM